MQNLPKNEVSIIEEKVEESTIKTINEDHLEIKTYPVVSLTTKENHLLEENSTILLKNINRSLKIYIEKL